MAEPFVSAIRSHFGKPSQRKAESRAGSRRRGVFVSEFGVLFLEKQ